MIVCKRLLGHALGHERVEDDLAEASRWFPLPCTFAPVYTSAERRKAEWVRLVEDIREDRAAQINDVE